MQTNVTDEKEIGVVYKKMLGFYNVHRNGSVIECTLSAKLWKDFEYTKSPNGQGQRVQAVTEKHMDPIAIGDRVQISLAGDGTGVITEVLPRKNVLARESAKPMPGAHAFEQVIAANIDQVIPVFAAADPTPKWHMLDRYLVTAEAYNIPATVVITKLDLMRQNKAESELMAVVERYRRIGYPVVLTSAEDGEGLESLNQVLSGKVSVLVGKSGVGKSTLLNALEPDLGLRVQGVNQTTGKGKHTTTHLEMFPLAIGGAIIDTPGVREFGLYDIEPDEVAYYFPEMRPLLGQCKFGLSCKHDEEPGCAIRQAVMDGEISPYRYKSYLRLKADL
jgi:ribosome biogenesis GTPase / thiamine phosphate phosphatase